MLDACGADRINKIFYKIGRIWSAENLFSALYTPFEVFTADA